MIEEYFLSFVVGASQFICVKKTQVDAQLNLSIYRQPLHVSGLSRSFIRRYNCRHTTIGTHYWNNL